MTQGNEVRIASTYMGIVTVKLSYIPDTKEYVLSVEKDDLGAADTYTKFHEAWFQYHKTLDVEVRKCEAFIEA